MTLLPPLRAHAAAVKAWSDAQKITQASGSDRDEGVEMRANSRQQPQGRAEGEQAEERRNTAGRRHHSGAGRADEQRPHSEASRTDPLTHGTNIVHQDTSAGKVASNEGRRGREERNELGRAPRGPRPTRHQHRSRGTSPAHRRPPARNARGASSRHDDGDAMKHLPPHRARLPALSARHRGYSTDRGVRARRHAALGLEHGQQKGIFRNPDILM